MADSGEDLVTFRVQPGARTVALERLADGTWKVRLAAPAVDGRANEALVRQLAAWLDVPRSAVEIRRGHGSRQKLVAVRGLPRGEGDRRLAAIIG